MRPPAPASGSGLGELTLRLCRARGGKPRRAPTLVQRMQRMAGWLMGKRKPHFPYYSPLPDCTVDWYMVPGHPLHAALAKRLGLGRDAIIGIQGKATFPDSATATFCTKRSETHSGYHIDDEHVHVFQLQVLVSVDGGEVILSKANLKPFNKAFISKVTAAVRDVVARRRTSAEQGQLLLEVFVTMPELQEYDFFDEDDYLKQINLAIPDGRPHPALSDNSVSSPDILGRVAPGSKMDSSSLKGNLTRIRNGNGTDWTRLYRHMYVPADAARFLRGETDLVSVMDGDGPNQAVLVAWPARGWGPNRPRGRKRQKKRQPQPRKKRR